MSEAESPQRSAPGHEVTIEDVRQLMGASTPHFALQLRNRIAKLIRPLPPDHPLWRLPNVIVTPHVGSATVQTRAAMDEMAVTNLLEVLAGRPPLARVELYGEAGGPQPTQATKGL